MSARDPRNPVIRVRLSDVDYESVVENAKGEDNDGRRRELIKDLVREALGVTTADPDVFGVYTHSLVWRGSRRTVDLVFGNVRDASWLTDDHFRARPGTWRMVIDHPFDEAGHSGGRRPQPPRPDDRGRVHLTDDRVAAAFPVRGADARRAPPGHPGLAAHRGRGALDRPTPTTCPRWTGPRPGPSWRSQRTQLREGLRRAVQECYGAAAPSPGTLAEDSGARPGAGQPGSGVQPAAPVGADLYAAFANLADQAFSATYPGHPRFEPAGTEVTVRDLAAVYGHVERAVADPDGRVRLEGDITGGPPGRQRAAGRRRGRDAFPVRR